MATRKRLPQSLIGFSTTPGSGASWSVTGATSVTQNTGDTTAPDGTSTATKFLETNATEQHRFYFAQSQGYRWPLTTSIYAKAGTRNWCYFTVNDSAGTRAWFNLSTGTIGVVDSGAQARMTKVYQPDGTWNGWWRCEVTMSPTASLAAGIAQSMSFGLTSGDGVVTGVGNGTGTMYFWGPQGEMSDSAGDYVPTTTVAGSNVTIAGQNRRLPQNYFSNGVTLNGFTQSNLTSVQGATAPDGSTNATTVTDSNDAGNTSHYMFNGASGVVASSRNLNTVWTMSVYAKKGTKDKIALTPGGASWQVTFDLTNGVVGNTLNVQPIIARCEAVRDSTGALSGWYRCSITFLVTTAAQLTAMASDNRIWMCNTLAALQYTGAGTGTVFLWGAQIEQNDAPGDLVPTTSSGATPAAAVTMGTTRKRQPQNLVSPSSTFSSASWGKNFLNALGAPFAGPVGNAYLATSDGSVNAHYITQIPSPQTAGKTYVLSCYVKAGAASWVLLAIGSIGAYFDVSTGVTGNLLGGAIASSIKAVAGWPGWYRCQVTVTAALAIDVAGLYIASANGVFVGAMAGLSLNFCGAQVEQSNGAGDYVSTDTALFQNLAVSSYNPSGAVPLRRSTA